MAVGPRAPAAGDPELRYFDLNIERVLEHWSIAEAVRELIANALDEQALTSTREPEISEFEGGLWRIRDWGRGLRYSHFTQNEDTEKLSKPGLVIGKFGFGLKDAVAALERRGANVSFRSRHGDIGIARVPKHGFGDLKTLHAVVRRPSNPRMEGTELTLVGVSAEQIAAAKSLFLRYSGREELEKTEFGSVLRRGRGWANVYVNGLKVAEEPNFLFAYNIMALGKKLRDALNRERSNVGRQAYTDRVKAILMACSSSDVADALAEDLAKFTSGKSHDETGWIDVAVHACKVLNAHQKVVFVTPDDLQYRAGMVKRATADGNRIVVVPDSVAHKLPRLKDAEGNPMRDLDCYLDEWNHSFEYDLVDPTSLSAKEREVFALVEPTLALVKPEAKRVKQVLISNTMRLSAASGGEAVGVWEGPTARIIIKRDQLKEPHLFLGTLMHEVAHALTGADDLDEAFEHGLTHLLGKSTQAAVSRPTTGDVRTPGPADRADARQRRSLP